MWNVKKNQYENVKIQGQNNSFHQRSVTSAALAQNSLKSFKNTWLDFICACRQTCMVGIWKNKHHFSHFTNKNFLYPLIICNYTKNLQISTKRPEISMKICDIWLDYLTKTIALVKFSIPVDMIVFRTQLRKIWIICWNEYKRHFVDCMFSWKIHRIRLVQCSSIFFLNYNYFNYHYWAP